MKKVIMIVVSLLFASISWAGVSNPVNGTVVQDDSTGKITFIPTPGFTGVATFDYSITDGKDTATATVTINILDIPNNPPVANPDSFEIYKDTQLVLNPSDLIGNDTDADGDELTLTPNTSN